MVSVSAVNRLPAADKTKYKTYLQKFETSRNHYRQDSREELKNATLLLKEKFESAGLDVKLHNFTTSDTTTGQVSGSTFIYYVAELVHGEKEHSDWFPERSIFCYTDC